MPTCRNLALLAAGLLFLTPAARAAPPDRWPQWRGPHGNGISDEKNPPVHFGPKENVLWRLPLPGPAGATPVVWGDRIFLTSVDGGQLMLLCVDRSGKLLWQRQVAAGNKDVRGDEGNSASPSPLTDGEHVWTFMANGALACYDFDGNEVWKFNVQDRYGKLQIQFGMTSTPVLDGDRLYLQLIHGSPEPENHEARVICLDKRSGKEIWQQTRVTAAHDECKQSYASPIIYRDAQRAFLITHGGDTVIAHDLGSGREIWRCGELNFKDNYNPTLRFIASPAAVPGLIVVPTAKLGKVVGIRPDGHGDITHSPTAIAWELPKNTPDVPSPLIQGGIVYLCREIGVLMALDAQTGKKIYERRFAVDRYRASPVYAAGMVYLTGRKGVVTIVKAGPKFEVLANNDMGEPISSSPVIVGGRIYLRTFESLYAIGPR